MPMTADQMIRLLESNGFQFQRAKGSHRIYRNPETGKMVVVPYHKKDLKPGTEKDILRKAGLL